MSGSTQGESGRPRAATSDPVLHLQREHTLLEQLSGRMREVADGLHRHDPGSAEEAGRGLAIHQEILIELHHAKEALLADAVRELPDHGREAALAQCDAAHPKAKEFQREAALALAEARRGVAAASERLAALFRSEADRLIAHHGEGEGKLYKDLEKLLPRRAQDRLAELFRGFNAKSSAAEARLAAWSSKLHPASD
jgi:hypothetical protein